VTACEKTDKQTVDHVLLADDTTRHLPRDVLHKSRIGSRRYLSSHEKTGLRVEGRGSAAMEAVNPSTLNPLPCSYLQVPKASSAR